MRIVSLISAVGLIALAASPGMGAPTPIRKSAVAYTNSVLLTNRGWWQTLENYICAASTIAESGKVVPDMHSNPTALHGLEQGHAPPVMSEPFFGPKPVTPLWVNKPGHKLPDTVAQLPKPIYRMTTSTALRETKKDVLRTNKGILKKTTKPPIRKRIKGIFKQEEKIGRRVDFTDSTKMHSGKLIKPEVDINVNGNPAVIQAHALPHIDMVPRPPLVSHGIDTPLPAPIHSDPEPFASGPTHAQPQPHANNGLDSSVIINVAPTGEAPYIDAHRTGVTQQSAKSPVMQNIGPDSSSIKDGASTKAAPYVGAGVPDDILSVVPHGGRGAVVEQKVNKKLVAAATLGGAIFGSAIGVGVSEAMVHQAQAQPQPEEASFEPASVASDPIAGASTAQELDNLINYMQTNPEKTVEIARAVGKLPAEPMTTEQKKVVEHAVAAAGAGLPNAGLGAASMASESSDEAAKGANDTKMGVMTGETSITEYGPEAEGTTSSGAMKQGAA
ncbi:hypothetical protein FRB94_011458 [Tulasnella sp. JGI-2019a]|nr:hypothetical protein FRB94_011458 [Tulasnella sp. JGI-2019a]